MAWSNVGAQSNRNRIQQQNACSGLVRGCRDGGSLIHHLIEAEPLPKKQTAASLPSPSVRTCPIGISRAMAPPKTVVSTLTGLELLSTTVQLLSLSRSVHVDVFMHPPITSVCPPTIHCDTEHLSRARVGEQSIVHDPMLHPKFRMRSISHKKYMIFSLSLYLIGLFVWDVGTQNKGEKQE